MKTTGSKAFSIGALLLTCLPSMVQAGAWTQPEGGTYLRLASKWYQADEIFNGSGSRQKGDWWNSKSSFSDISFNLIAEYGV